MKAMIKKALPTPLRVYLSFLRQGLKVANITQPTGKLSPLDGKQTLVMVVGPAFDQDRPDAMMTCRMGYCHAFEELGIPYVIADIRTLADIVPGLPSPFLMYFAADMQYFPKKDIARLRQYPSAVWVFPWFEDSDRFFSGHGLDARIWTLPVSTNQKILDLAPRFCFTATTPSGLNYFENWVRHGLQVKSYPLACDNTVYQVAPSATSALPTDIALAFVGGYWASKGYQIDRYLRPFEDLLMVYGYSVWPYSGYGGKLPLELEPELYRRARVCPVINEPTVALLKGQINERVFKVLGSGGCPVVDAVPAYRELFSEEELLVSENADQFRELVELLLNDRELNARYRDKGRQAVLDRHTYIHRAQAFLRDLAISDY